MKKRTRSIALLLALAMLLAAVASGCGKTETDPEEVVSSENVTQKEQETPEEQITLKFITCTNDSCTIPMAENKLFTDYEEVSGIHIEFTEIPFANWAEQVQLSLASGDLPDAYANGMAAIDSGLIQEYADQGVLIPLNDLIEEHTVNLKKYLAENEELRKLCTMADGNIYSIPVVHQNSNRAFWQLVINKTWLDQLGMDYPKTMEEFKEFLRAVKNTDMDGNGKNDEIAFSVAGAGFLNYLMGAFGTLDAGDHIYINDNDEISFSAISEEYREFLEFMNELYVEGLLDPESFTQDTNMLNAKAASSSGIAATIEFQIDRFGETICDYEIAPPLEGDDGSIEWIRNGRINDVYLNGFSITSANEHPIETIKWLDYWMDNGEHMLTMRYGTKGEYWDYTGNGDEWEVYNELSDGTPIDGYMRGTVCTQALVIPMWMFSDTYANMSTENLDEYTAEKIASQDWYDPYLSNPYPVVYMTSDDTTELTNLATELDPYITSMQALFITEGVTDDAWNDYVQRCKALGADRYLEIKAQYYAEYLAK